MSNLKGFPGRTPAPERITNPVPTASDVFPTFEDFPGAPKASDRAMIGNLPPLPPGAHPASIRPITRPAYPGSGYPGEPIAPAPAIAPRRLRRDK